MNYPNKIIAVLSAAAATAVGLTAPAHALPSARSVPPESFLDYHVDTAPQLAFEVAYDGAVRARLARHFRLGGPAMSAYVRDNLVLKRLRAPLRTRVYCITAHGHEHYVVMTLKTGSSVFAQRGTGKPVLRLVCGNPLLSALPAALNKAAATPPAKPPAKTLVESDQATQAAPLPAAGVTPAAWSVPDVLTSGPGETLFTQGASGGGWLALVPAVFGLGGLIVTTHHDSGSGGGQAVAPSSATFRTTGGQTTTTPFIPAVPAGGSPDGPTPVPEPGPICVFALGGLTLGVLRLRPK